MSGNGSQEARHVCSEGEAMGSAACINGRARRAFPGSTTLFAMRPKSPISLIAEAPQCTVYAQAACVGLTGCTARKLIAIRFHALIAATATVRFTSSVLEKCRLASS
jgi:hypothetical protein